MKSALADLFTVPVRIVLRDIVRHDDRDAALLYPEEAVTVANAATRRRAEYAAGRLCARAALDAWGAAPGPIPSRPDRSPVWPDGYTGSISHCPDRCVAVAAPLSTVASLGIDVEHARLADANLYAQICRPEELAEWTDRPELALAAWAALAFSAKEAYYKAHYPLAGTFLDFQEVRLDVRVDAGARSGTFAPSHVDLAGAPPPGRQFFGRWLRQEHHLFTAVTCIELPTK